MESMKRTLKNWQRGCSKVPQFCHTRSLATDRASPSCVHSPTTTLPERPRKVRLGRQERETVRSASSSATQELAFVVKVLRKKGGFFQVYREHTSANGQRDEDEDCQLREGPMTILRGFRVRVRVKGRGRECRRVSNLWGHLHSRWRKLSAKDV